LKSKRHANLRGAFFTAFLLRHAIGAWFIIRCVSLFLTGEFAESEDVQFSEDEAAEES